MSVLDFGAKCDGNPANAKVDSAALTAAIAAAAHVRIPATANCVLDNVALPSNTEIAGIGATASISVPETARYALSANAGTGGTANIADNVHDITIRGLNFRGTADTSKTDYLTNSGDFEHHFMLNLNAVSKVLVLNNIFTAWLGDAIYIGSSNQSNLERHNTDVRIDGNVFDGVNKQNRNAVSLIDVDGAKVTNNVFKHTSAPNMPGAIDMEPNPHNAFAIMQNITISGNTFDDIGGDVGAIALQPQQGMTHKVANITINNNIIGNTAAHAFSLDGGLSQEEVNDNMLPAQNIVVRSNSVHDCSRPFGVYGAKGVLFENNMFTDCQHAALVSFEHKVGLAQVSFHINTFLRDSLLEDNCLNVNTVAGLSMTNNTFSDCGKVALFFSHGIGTAVHITGNQFGRTSPRMTHAMKVAGDYVLDKQSSVVEKNVATDPGVSLDY